MNRLTNFLVETIINEDAGMDYIVVYSGRFQPFHKGHYATYTNLVKKFGKDKVYIATSNVTDNKKSPFNFAEKKLIMTKMFGIPDNKIVMIKNPYVPTEILDKYNAKTTGLITVVGEKDEARLGGKYFIPYKGVVEYGYDEKGYVYASPAQSNPISGTDVRSWLSNGTDSEKRKNFLKAYPKFNETIYKLISDRLSKLGESVIYEASGGEAFPNDGNATTGNYWNMDWDEFDDPEPYIGQLDGWSILPIEKNGLEKIRNKEIPLNDHGDKIKGNYILDLGIIPPDEFLKNPKTDKSKYLNKKQPVIQSKGFHNEPIEKPSNFAEKAKKEMTAEDINLDVNVGDTVLMGKFKNKKVVVTDIGEDENGMPTINGRQATTFRRVGTEKTESFLSDDEINDLVDEALGLYMGYPSAEQLAAHEKEIKRLRKKLDKSTPSQTYNEPYALGGGISESAGDTKLKMNIPSDIMKIYTAFKKHGKKLYVVGGAVRDAILGKSPKDFDLATDAKPDEVLDIAKKEGFHSTEVGKSFGVVIVNGNEIATFRKDIGKGRRPDAVDYTDIAGDVRRRDLTINALFYDIDRHEIVDLVGGISDLHNKKIRTVGDAGVRFDEDPLRKLRALRFYAQMGGVMDTDTYSALKSNTSLSGVSPERIRDEFIKSINKAKSTKHYLNILSELGYINLILPNLKISKPYIDDNDYIVLLAYILRENNSDSVFKTLHHLKYTLDECKNISFLISLQKFDSKSIFQYKRNQSVTTLTNAQIIKFGKLINLDLNKFVNFNLSVKGSDAPNTLSGKDIGKWVSDKEYSLYAESITELVAHANNGTSIRYTNDDVTEDPNEIDVDEMALPALKAVEKHADTKLSPIDIVTAKHETDHFFQRLNDPRNKVEITDGELQWFFDRLAHHKQNFIDFLTKYKEFVVSDKRTNINIPFLRQSNKIIAKTIMRKKNFLSNTPVYTIEGVEHLDEVAWEDKTINMIRNYNIPLSSELANILYGGIYINAFHITDGNGISGIKNLLGKKKSISGFTYLDDFYLRKAYGVQTSGGIILQIEGKLNAVSIVDLMTMPDESGRRWTSAYYMFNSDISDKFVSGFNRKIKSIFADIQISNDRVVGIETMSGADKRKFIQIYIDFAYDFCKKHKDDALKELNKFGESNSLAQHTQWNEVAISDIKVRDAIVFQPMFTDSQRFSQFEMLESIASGTVHYTDNSADIIKFVKDRGGFDKRTFIRDYEYKKLYGGQVGVTDIKKLKRTGINEDVTWQEKTLQHTLRYRIPVTSKIGKALYGDTNIVSFHVSDAKNIDGVKKLTGSRKSLSTFTYMADYLLDKMHGIQTNGGIIYQVQGKLLINSLVDLMTRPDEHGRRWVDVPRIMSGTLVNQYSDYMDNALNTELPFSKGNAKRWSPTQKQQYIKRTIELGEDFIVKHKNEIIDFIKHDVDMFNQSYSMYWNELLVNDVTILDVLVYNKYMNQDELADVDKKLKSFVKGKIYYTNNPKDSKKFTQDRGGFDKVQMVDRIKTGSTVGTTNYKTVAEVSNLANQTGYLISGAFDEEDTDITDESNLDLMDSEGWESFDKHTNKYKKSIKEDVHILEEGGAYGHMAHVFDIEMNLTFGDLKNIVKNALTGELGVTKEKTDGQAMSISWKNGKIIAARNKSHTRDFGQNAMSISDVADKFGGRGGLTDAYNFAMQDLSKAIAALSEKQRTKIFNNGHKFMNIEVIYPESVNVIPYGQALLVFHSIFEYDVNGDIISQDVEAARILAGMIKQVNQHVQQKYKIQGPPVNQLPKNEELMKLQPKYLSMISHLQNEFKLKDSDGVADYHQAWWTDFVEKNAKSLPNDQKVGLVKRWAFNDKSFRIKDIKDDTLRVWAEKIEREDKTKISKENIMKFESIFLGVGSDVLSFMQSVLTVNPDEAKRQIGQRLKDTINTIRASGDIKKIEKLKLELKRLQSIGGFDKIVPNEGIVFEYPKDSGKIWKLTGAFSALNQLLGIMYEK